MKYILNTKEIKNAINRKNKLPRIIQRKVIFQGNRIPIKNIKKWHMLLAALAHLAEGLGLALLLAVEME
jgi:hypothetical protein